MIQDIGAEYDRSYALRPPRPEDPVLCYTKEGVSVTAESPLSFPRAADFEPARLRYLFRVGGEHYYLADGAPAGTAGTLERRALRSALPDPRARCTRFSTSPASSWA